MKHSSLLPREKLFSLGAAALRDWELWACVLQTGRKGYSVYEMAKCVVSMHGVFSSRVQPALGEAQLARVEAVRELCRRSQRKKEQTVRSLNDVLLLARGMRRFRQEHVRVWYCSTSGEVVHEEVVAVGSLNAVAIGPREIFSVLGTIPFDSLVLVHNHPSGNPQPSTADIIFTARLEAACEIMGCWLRDHVIVAKAGHYSFREAGKLISGQSTFPEREHDESSSLPE